MVVFILSLSIWANHDAPPKPVIPEWAKGALWYHIVPDRFRNALPANDPTEKRSGDVAADWQVHPWAANWYKRQVWESDTFEAVIKQRRFGGDLVGVIEKLPYLKDLGVKVIQLSPVFESPSIFKYDATTLHHVDNNFGTARKDDWHAIISEREEKEKWTVTKGDSAFVAFIDEAHKENIKVVLEAEFNFVNREFWAFADLVARQEESSYRDWFEISAWDKFLTPDTNEFAYLSWPGNNSWPRFKTDAQDFCLPVKTYLFDITKRWMDPDNDGNSKDGIDGWSVHNWDALPAGFRREWTSYVRKLNAEALIVTDSVHEGREELLAGSNAAFSDSLIHYIGSDTTYSAARLNLLLSHGLPKRDASFAVNPVAGSHDTRAITSIKYAADSDTFLTRSFRDIIKPSKSDYDRYRLLLTLHLTLPGSPSIIQGDETGMWGSLEPENFKPMLWWEYVFEDEDYSQLDGRLDKKSKVEFDRPLYKYIRQLARIRSKNAVMRLGSFDLFLEDEDRGILAFFRRHGESEALVILNLSTEDIDFELKAPWENGSRIKEMVSETDFRIKDNTAKITIKRRASVVLVKD